MRPKDYEREELKNKLSYFDFADNSRVDELEENLKSRIDNILSDLPLDYVRTSTVTDLEDKLENLKIQLEEKKEVKASKYLSQEFEKGENKKNIWFLISGIFSFCINVGLNIYFISIKEETFNHPSFYFINFSLVATGLVLFRIYFNNKKKNEEYTFKKITSQTYLNMVENDSALTEEFKGRLLEIITQFNNQNITYKIPKLSSKKNQNNLPEIISFIIQLVGYKNIFNFIKSLWSQNKEVKK